MSASEDENGSREASVKAPLGIIMVRTVSLADRVQKLEEQVRSAPEDVGGDGFHRGGDGGRER